MVELAVLENAHRGVLLASDHLHGTIHHFGRRNSQVEDSARPARSAPRLITRLRGATAAGLRFQEGRDVPELVSDRGSVDSPERAADVQSPFVLQHFHAAPADGGVDVLIDPRPWDRRHLRQIDKPGTCSYQSNSLAALQHQF